MLRPETRALAKGGEAAIQPLQSLDFFGFCVSAAVQLPGAREPQPGPDARSEKRPTQAASQTDIGR